MGFKFRKSVKMGPVRVNLSKSGVGYSVGGKGFRVTKKAGGGTRTTASIPGTGISYSTDSQKKRKATAKKTATTKAAKKNAAIATHPTDNFTQKKTKGCMIGCLGFSGICIAIVMACTNFKAFITLSILSAVAFAGIKYCKKYYSQLVQHQIFETSDNTNCVSLMSEKADSIPNSEQIVPQKRELTSQEKFELRCAESAKQFDEELQAIPQIEVTLSDPAPRQLLKNLPEYSFSNITRKTRLDSIFPLVFLDVETTGFAPSKCEILEVSAIKFESGMTPISAFTTLCKPSKPIPGEASAINHITDDMVADAPAFAQIAPALTNFLNGCHIAGHNLDFDLRFIYAHGVHFPEKVRFYDTLDLAHLTIPQSSIYNYKLDSVCHHYGIWRDNAHRSLSDAYATSKIFTALVQDKTSRQLDINGEIESEKNAE